MKRWLPTTLFVAACAGSSATPPASAPRGGASPSAEAPAAAARRGAWQDDVTSLELRMAELRLSTKGTRTNDDLRRTRAALERLAVELEELYAAIDASWNTASIDQQTEIERLHARLAQVRVDARAAQLAIDETLRRRNEP